MTDPVASDRPLVSIIICFLNPGEFLREAVESVFRQDYSRWELALVDDGSADESTSFAKDCAARHPGRVLYAEHPRHENRGLAASRNLGLAATRGELVALLDADDVWPPAKLAKQVSVMDDNPAVDLVCGPGLYWYSWTGDPIDADRDYVQPMLMKQGVMATPTEFLPRMIREPESTPCPGAILLRRNAIVKVRGFEDSFRGMFEDQAFYAKLGLTCNLINTGAVSLFYRQHAKSLCRVALEEGTHRVAYRHYLEWLLRYLEVHAPAVPEGKVAAREMWRRNFGPLANLRAGLVGLLPGGVRKTWRKLRTAASSPGRPGGAR